MIKGKILHLNTTVYLVLGVKSFTYLSIFYETLGLRNFISCLGGEMDGYVCKGVDFNKYNSSGCGNFTNHRTDSDFYSVNRMKVISISVYFLVVFNFLSVVLSSSLLVVLESCWIDFSTFC